MKHWPGQPDHDHWRKPFTPREHAYAWWGLALVGWVLALNDYLHPTHPPFTGKGAWLYRWAFDAFGPSGIVGIMVVAAVLCTIAGLARFMKRPV